MVIVKTGHKKRQGHFLALPAMFREQRLLLEPSPYDRETGKAGAKKRKSTGIGTGAEGLKRK